MLERVEVLPHLMEAWHAFHDLSPGRPKFEGGEDFILVREIEAYCRLCEIGDVEDRLDLLRMIRAMDVAYLKEQARLREEKREAEKVGKRPPGGA